MGNRVSGCLGHFAGLFDHFVALTALTHAPGRPPWRFSAGFRQRRRCTNRGQKSPHALAHPARRVAGGDHTICVSGNDAAAKAEVSRLLAEWFGWRDIIDLGDITTACGTESLLPVWVRLMVAFGHANFQFKIVR